MLFQIRHQTRFTYTKPVYCEPLTIRLRPRDDSGQQLAQFEVHISPTPTGQSQYLDLNSNVVTHAWFQDLTTELLITTDSVVATNRTNPFNFLTSPGAIELPWENTRWTGGLFDHFRQSEVDSEPLTQLSQEVLESSDRQTLDFLCQLTHRIYEEVETKPRLAGEAQAPELTWSQKVGACRDQAVLLNEVCRIVGIPARFVSGYVWGNDEQQEHHLHAWSEVYLPGAGWRGFDPTTGLAVADSHVAVAAGRLPEDAAPTTGSFRGTDAQSHIETQVLLRATSERTLPTRPHVTDPSRSGSQVGAM